MNIRNKILKNRFVCRLSNDIHIVCNYSPKAFESIGGAEHGGNLFQKLCIEQLKIRSSPSNRYVCNLISKLKSVLSILLECWRIFFIMMIFYYAEAYFRQLNLKILEISSISVWHPLCIIIFNPGWFPVFSNIVVHISVSTGKGTLVYIPRQVVLQFT